MTEEKETAAICGLWCKSCVAYIGTHEQPTRLELLSKSTGHPVENLKCNGCRSNRLTWYCQTCKIATCARDKGVEFCGSCHEFPCELITAFHGSLPHRAEIIPSLSRIQEVGWQNWYNEMRQYNTCNSCGTINTAYDLKCRLCGAQPSCDFVDLHQQAIQSHLDARRG
jgi:hypothetical protein